MREETPSGQASSSQGFANVSDTERSDSSDSSATFSGTLNPSSRIASQLLFRPVQTYRGDRYIPMRRGYNFEAAHHLLKNTKFCESNIILKREDISIYIDVRKQVSMRKTHSRLHLFICTRVHVHAYVIIVYEK